MVGDAGENGLFAVRASRLASELARVRQRGLNDLDKQSHNQKPVVAEKLTILADGYCRAFGFVLHDRRARIERFLDNALTSYGLSASDREAQFIRSLFFDPDSSPGAIRSPGELLRLARNRYGPHDEQRFTEYRRDAIARFANFLISFEQEMAGDSNAPGSNQSDPENAAWLTPLSKGIANRDLTGIWRSWYSYRSSSRDDQEFESEHYLVVRQHGANVDAVSLPNKEGSQVRIRLVVDGSIATGTWSERTSPTEYYAGATYHGTLQMIVDPRGRRLKGKWLGFDTEFKVKVGDWTLTWVEGSVSEDTQRKYHNKV